MAVPGRILIVDLDVQAANDLKDAVEVLGHDAQVVTSPDAAVTLAQDGFEAVLCDFRAIQAAGEDSWLQRLCGGRKMIVLIVAFKADVPRAVTASNVCNGYVLPKPFDMKTLKWSLEMATQKARA